MVGCTSASTLSAPDHLARRRPPRSRSGPSWFTVARIAAVVVEASPWPRAGRRRRSRSRSHAAPPRGPAPRGRGCGRCPSAWRVWGSTLKASPAWNIRHRHHAGSSGSTLRDDDRLQRRDDLRRRPPRCRSQSCGMRGVAAAALDVIVKRSAAAIIGPGADAERADRHARHVVHAVDLARRRSGPSGRPRPWPCRRRRLPRPAGRSPPPCRRSCASRPGSAAAPSSMAVWPSWPQACILPGVCRGVGLAGRLDDRQRVHVGAQADRPRRPAGGP